MDKVAFPFKQNGIKGNLFDTDIGFVQSHRENEPSKI